jgi:hypothetical protein
VIVPAGVLFGSTNTHRALRRQLLFENTLEAAVSPSGNVFQLYSGVKTSILVLQKAGQAARPGDPPRTREVFFYEVEDEAYTLDQKRNPRPGKDNDLWDALAKFHAWKHHLAGALLEGERPREPGLLEGERPREPGLLEGEAPAEPSTALTASTCWQPEFRAKTEGWKVHNVRIAQHLTAGLTPGQLAGLVARLLGSMSEAEWTAFCGTLEPDVAAVLQRLGDPPPADEAATDAGGTTSDAKFATQFHAVLGALQGLLSELGDEDGDYIVQEHHWEPPDFDASRLGKDIERCAQDLLPLLDRAAALDLEDESLFVDLCQEITDGIGQYPEHIYTEDGVEFGSTATECVLKWLDLHAETEAGFLDGLVATLRGRGSVSFEAGTIRAYLLDGWPEARRRALYRAIEDRRAASTEFRAETEAPRTLWHDIRQELARAFDAATSIAIAEAAVSGDWTKGVELVEAALAEGNSARALEFCRKTVEAYYRRRSWAGHTASFDPGTTPLLGAWGVHNESPSLSSILGIWADLAAKVGDQRLAGLLTVQQALFTRPDDWTAVRTAFAQAGRADTSVLFRGWKEQALRQQHGVWVYGVPQDTPVWVGWLIDAGFAERLDTFTEQALAWLGEKLEAGGKGGRSAYLQALGHIQPPQMSLVAELFALGSSTEGYPALRAMLAQHCRLNPRPCPARLEWLGRTDTARLTAAGIGFVRRNMASLVPSPGCMGGHYELAAGWLAVARELAPGIAQSTLQRWQIDFKRRRNLWRDLRARGFEVGPK